MMVLHSPKLSPCRRTDITNLHKSTSPPAAGRLHPPPQTLTALSMSTLLRAVPLSTTEAAEVLRQTGHVPIATFQMQAVPGDPGFAGWAMP